MHIKTISGLAINPHALETHDIDLRDIAHGLSQVHPWPQARECYSLAQRAVHMMEIARAPSAFSPGMSAETEREFRSMSAWCLLMNAPAAYGLRPDEDAFGIALLAIARRCCLGPRHELVLARIDAMVQAAERAALFGLPLGDPAVDDLPATMMVVPAAAAEAERMFLSSLEDFAW